MNKDIVIFDTLLKGISSDEFDALINQERLRSQGYELHFVLDANLIYNYCFPEGIEETKTGMERRLKLTSEYIADEQVTLHSIFFLNKQSDRVVFFDQYVPEIEHMITQAINYKAINVDDNSILSYENFSEHTKLSELAINSFSVIFADLLKHINGLKKISNLFNNKALLIEANDLESDFVAKTTKLIKGTKQVTDLIKAQLSDIIKDELFESKKRDAVVFDRVLSINNFIQKFGEREDRKHIFILLTDSTILKNLGVRLFNNIQGVEYPIFHSDKIELTRSVGQAFAYLISLVYLEGNKIDHKQTIENIEKLKIYNVEIQQRINETEKIIQSNDPGKEWIDLLSSERYGDVFNNYKRLRNIFENSGLLRSFEGLYSSVKPNLNNKRLHNFKNFFEEVNAIIVELNAELDNKHIKYLRGLWNEAIFNTSFINGIEQIKLAGQGFDLNKGGDIIEGSYQRLPIFLTFSKVPSLQIHAFNLLSLILHRKPDDSQAFCNELDELLSKMIQADSIGDSPFEVKLLKAFIFVILPSIEENIKSKNKRNNDSIALKWLQNLSSDPNSNEPELRADLLYLQCWAARRIPDYVKSIEYAEKGVDAFPEDPRFYHGKFLAQYCILENTNDQHQHLMLIDEMIENLKKALKNYDLFINKFYSGFENGILLTQKLIDTFNNNFCSCFTLKARCLRTYYNQKFDNTDVLKLLEIARNYLNCLKNDDGQFKDLLPEYLDTEANLELVESFYLENDNKKQKLYYAKKAIKKAIEISTNVSLIEKYNRTLMFLEKQLFP